MCKIDFISASSLQPDSPHHMKLYDLSVFTKDVCTPSLAPSVIILRSVCIFKRQCLWEAIRARLHDPPGWIRADSSGIDSTHCLEYFSGKWIVINQNHTTSLVYSTYGPSFFFHFSLFNWDPRDPCNFIKFLKSSMWMVLRL